jgi:hypothetical protein
VQKQLITLILTLLFFSVCVPWADSMTSRASFPGNHPILQRDWPFGENALNLANLESRVVYSYPVRGPDAPPYIRHHFYYRFSNAEELNEALRIFSLIASATLLFVIYEYPDPWSQTGWRFSIGSDYQSPVPGAFSVGEPLPPYVEYPPRISVHASFWNNVRDEVEVPQNIKVIDQSRESMSQTTKDILNKIESIGLSVAIHFPSNIESGSEELMIAALSPDSATAITVRGTDEAKVICELAQKVGVDNEFIAPSNPSMATREGEKD